QGPDTFQGGRGNDVYVFSRETRDVHPDEDPTDLGGAVITELAGEAPDTVMSGSWSIKLPDNVETLFLSTPNAMGSFYFNTTSPSNYTHRLAGNTANNLIDTTAYEQAASSQ